MMSPSFRLRRFPPEIGPGAALYAQRRKEFSRGVMKFVLAAAAIAALAVTSASAADLPARSYTKAPAYVAPVYNWTGFYVGAFVGGTFGTRTDTVFTGPSVEFGGKRKDAFFGGGQLGFNYQLAPNWVAGIEGDIGAGSRSDRVFSNTGFGGPNLAVHESGWLASVTGRLGYTWGAGLIYAKGGFAFRERSKFDILALPGTDTFTHDTGYTIGGGLEYMFAPAWSAKIEYQYYNFERSGVNTGIIPILNYRDDLHTVKAGINYHFNWDHPVVAKY
jgi:outer membrane immunogenic protein